jgi:ADP-ribose pyrophosphatase YjhB (NUDIX family)
VQQKVLAYVVRPTASRWQLLVFRHTGDPEAGVQVPAGTVEENEVVEAALWRERFEESGLSDTQVVKVCKLAEVPEPEWHQVRHVYLLQAVAEMPKAWTMVVGGGGEDHGMAFEYYWVAITPGLELAGGQHRWLQGIFEAEIDD